MNENEYNKIWEERNRRWEERKQRWQERSSREGRGGRVWMGVFIVIIGILTLMKSFSVPLPAWLFTWQMLLIGFGFFIGLKHGFRRGGWMVPIIVGCAFLANDYILDGQLREHIWPVALIIIGVIFILKPKHRHWHYRCDMKKKRVPGSAGTVDDKEYTYTEVNDIKEEIIDSTSVFGSSKKNILSKNFRGGDIVNIFGGTELDLSQADLQARASLEVTAIFGGTKLVVPPNWIIKSDVVSIFGGVTDKRPLLSIHENPEKVLLLRGTVLFGGIDIKSY